MNSEKCGWRSIALLAIAACLPCGGVQAAGDADQTIPLNVLYVGNPGSERMADFEKLLSMHFKKVETANYEKFKQEQADDFDVVVMDWTSTYSRDKNGKLDNANGVDGSPKSHPDLSGFRKPTLMIGQSAGTLTRNLSIAINWK